VQDFGAADPGLAPSANNQQCRRALAADCFEIAARRPSGRGIWPGTRICSAVITGSAGVGVPAAAGVTGRCRRAASLSASARLRPTTTLLGDLASEGGYCG
jgi:hypothetical protein